jgi:hypothetical protein
MGPFLTRCCALVSKVAELEAHSVASGAIDEAKTGALGDAMGRVELAEAKTEEFRSGVMSWFEDMEKYSPDGWLQSHIQPDDEQPDPRDESVIHLAQLLGLVKRELGAWCVVPEAWPVYDGGPDEFDT